MQDDTTRPIRITFCHYTADIYGGSDRCLFDLVTHLPKSRFQPAMILRNEDPLVPEYEKAGIPVATLRLVPPRRALEIGKLLKFLVYFWPSVFQIIRALGRFRADIVHVNTIYNLQSALAARLTRRPLAWHIRELSEGFIYNGFIMMVRLLASHVVVTSRAVEATMTKCGDRVLMIPDGIDLSDYANTQESASLRDEFNALNGEPIIATVGRLEHWKGQHILIEAIPKVLKSYPEARFLIVGGPAMNKPEYAEDLKKRCRALQIEKNVIFTGIRDDIPDILATVDALVLPTCTAEPWGRTVVEAMAAGCPVVATAAGGPLDTMVDGATGWLVPPNDKDALAGKICALLGNPDESRAMGEAGKKRAVDHFSLDRHVDNMSSLFGEMVSRDGIE